MCNLRDSIISKLRQQLQDLDMQLKGSQATVSKLQSELESQRRQLDDAKNLDMQLKGSQATVSELQSELESQRRQLDDAKNLDIQLKGSQATVSELQSELESQRRQLDDAKKDLYSANNRADKSNEHIQELNERIDNSKNANALIVGKAEKYLGELDRVRGEHSAFVTILEVFMPKSWRSTCRES
jgi:predicted  nucleic acid-binding Zn-ribbon protein